MKKNWKKEYLKAFGIYFRSIRVSKNLTQKGLSVLSGVSVSHITRIERGLSGPSLSVVRCFATALNIEPYKFFYFKFDDRLIPTNSNNA